MKKTLASVAISMISVIAFAQTDLQLFYDFGDGREYVTSTLEMFKTDNWGNTFFFVDYDYNFKMKDSDGKEYTASPGNTYFEIARCLNFWSKSAFAPFSLQIEYNGGFGSLGPDMSFPITSAWLFGVDYSLHNADFSNTLNLQFLYKKYMKDTESIPLQLTVVWGMHNLFGLKGLDFSGFADVYGQKIKWQDKDTDWALVSEPQLWYNVGRHLGCDNLNIGAEAEFGYNFSGNAENGFKCNPCFGLKWIF